jgi:tRNA G10  N-methylase Trm11
MDDIVRRFVKPEHVVMDPFLGGGATAISALTVGASFIGSDVDQVALDTTKVRLADVAK